MTEGTLQTSPTDGSDDPAASTAPGSPQFSSVEEAEAFYRARQSGIDKAHNAQLAAQQADFDRQMAAMRSQAQGSSPAEGESAEAARIRELEARVQTSEKAALLAQRKAEYPYAASLLGDEIANLSAGALAAAEATGNGGTNGAGFPVIAPNSAPRRPAGMPATKPQSEKTIEESLADLRALAPAYQAAVKERNGQ